jgi:poly(A) polymerase Pap1
VVGSARLGTQSLDSDTDILCLGAPTLAREAFNEALTKALPTLPEVEHFAVIVETRTPLIKIKLAAGEIDLLYARIPDALEPSLLQESLAAFPARVQAGSWRLYDAFALDTWEPSSLRSFQALLDALYIEGLLARYEKRSLFVKLVLALKAWAKHEAIPDQIDGGVGGIVWSLLAAWLCTHPAAASEIRVSRLLDAFFACFAHASWLQPLMLAPLELPLAEDPSSALWLLYNPTPPQRNCARYLRPEIATQIRAAFQRAHNNPTSYHP